MNRSQLQQYGIALLRIMIGVVFLAHGSQKLFTYGYNGVVGSMTQLGIPVPAVSAALIIAAEFGGGLFLLLGLFTRLAAIPVAFSMLVAVFHVHFAKGFFAQGGGYEYPLTLAIASLALMLTGAGAFAVDNVIGSDRRLFTSAPRTEYRMQPRKAA